MASCSANQFAMFHTTGTDKGICYFGNSQAIAAYDNYFQTVVGVHVDMGATDYAVMTTMLKFCQYV
jgi:hypothetical protein